MWDGLLVRPTKGGMLVQEDGTAGPHKIAALPRMVVRFFRLLMERRKAYSAHVAITLKSRWLCTFISSRDYQLILRRQISHGRLYDAILVYC